MVPEITKGPVFTPLPGLPNLCFLHEAMSWGGVGALLPWATVVITGLLRRRLWGRGVTESLVPQALPAWVDTLPGAIPKCCPVSG